MKRWRLTLLAAVVLAFLAGATPRAGQEGELVFEKTYPISRGGLLQLESGRGGVRITGESREDVLIQVRAEGRDVEEVREMLDLHVQETSDGLRVAVDLEQPGRSLFGWKRHGSGGRVWIDVSVPRETDLNLDNGSGGTRVSDIRGDVRVDNGSGGVNLSEIEGEVRIDNGSGGVSVGDIRGDVQVDNGSGGINVAHVVGDLSVENSSGGVKLEEIDGRLEIDNGSGGVKAELVGRNQGVTVESRSGGVVLQVPGDWEADLDLRSGSRGISVRGFPGLELEDVEKFQGTVGGGGPTISIRSGSGRVVLQAG